MRAGKTRVCKPLAGIPLARNAGSGGRNGGDGLRKLAILCQQISIRTAVHPVAREVGRVVLAVDRALRNKNRERGRWGFRLFFYFCKRTPASVRAFSCSPMAWADSGLPSTYNRR